MMAKSMGNKNTSLLKLVEERALSKKAEEEKKQNHVPYIPGECISNILVRLPLESLQKSRFVCKPWYNMINSSIFIDDHFGRSEAVLIFLTPVAKEKPNTFSVEANILLSESIPIFNQPIIHPTSKYYIQFLEIEDGKSKVVDFNASCLGCIRATCNGLILLDNKLKKGGLIVLNPVTRKLRALPPGTIYPSHRESYGFALSHLTSEYKVVHLFRDEMGYIGCEILNLGTISWTVVNGPSSGLFGWFGYEPVSAIGALHWVPQVDHNEYLVSMEIDDEKFHSIPLPKSSGRHDGIVEMRGLLCFVTHEEEINQMDIWILKGLCHEKWIKQHSITMGCIMDMVPLFSLRINEEMIFKRDEDGSLYAYDFQLRVMRQVEMPMGFSPLFGCCLPHINSMISWYTKERSKEDSD
ncbi:hypothetical protein L1049_025403 [Liquidambar formosana]|uniref:F-box domain-containing protein n=1 Tax=Liquidambar formosana TaxID=63359 RepID=A0AAP0NB70_LIQFO